jgi:uncharacterized protein YjiS (DUF1127 family)
MATQKFDETEQEFGAAVSVTGANDNERPARAWARVLARIWARVRAWPKHRPGQRDLACLNDHLLQDIGLEPRSAWRQTTPSVWDQWRS